MSDQLANAREAFLNMIADAVEFKEEPDGDVNEAGRMIDLTTYRLVTSARHLEELVDALGIERQRIDETLMEVIERAVSAEPTP